MGLAPTNLQPAGSVASAVNLTGNFADAAPVALVQTEIRLYAVGGATPLWDKAYVATSAERAARAFSVPIPVLVRSGTAYEWEARTQNSLGVWSAYSTPRVSFTILNSTPTVVLNSLGAYASLSGVKFKGTFSDANSADSLGAFHIQLRVTTAPGHSDWETDTNLWDTGSVPPTAVERSAKEFSRAYGGRPLTAATYSWRARVADNWGAWSAWVYGSITLSAAWNPDPGDIDFLTGYSERHSPTRVVIRPMGPNRGPVLPALAIIEDASNVGASQYLNAAGEFYMTLPATHPQVSVIEPYQVHYAVEFWNGDRYREMFAGIITDFDANDNDVVFYGTDYLGMMEKVVDSRYDPTKVDLPAPIGSKYVDQTTTAIILDQVAMAKAKANSPVAFIANGTFDAFPEKATIYSTFSGVLGFIAGLMESHRQGTGKRSRFWVRQNTDQPGGYEFLLKDDPGKDRPNLRMEYGGLIQSFRLVAFGDFAVTTHGVGRLRNGLSVFYASATAPGISPTTYGGIEQVRVWDAVNDQNDLTRRVKQAAASAGKIGKRIALALRVDALQPFDGYNIGDNVPIDIRRGVVDTSRYGSGYWSILGQEWKTFDDGHTENTLVVLPKEDGVAPSSDLIPSHEILAAREWEVGYVAPVQGVNTGKLYLDLSTGQTWVLNADGTYSLAGTPAIPVPPVGLSISTQLTTDATGDPIVKLTVTLIQPPGTANRGSWVEVTNETDNDPVTPAPIWDHAVLLFIPAGQVSASIEGVAGGTLYYARAWSVDFVGVPSTYSAAETHTSVTDSSAPPVPQGVGAVGGIEGFSAGWAAASAKDLAFYEIRYAVDGGAGTGPASPPVWVTQRARTSFVYVGGLLPLQRYWIQVRAVDNTGNVEETGPPLVARDFLAYPETGWSDQASVDTTLVDADLLGLGVVGDEHIAVAGLSAGKVTTGLLKISVSDATMIDGVEVWNGTAKVGLWNETGLYIYRDSNPTSYTRVYDGGITIFKNGAMVTAADENGLNASALTFGALPGGHNVVANSSFEMNAFSVPVTVSTAWSVAADWNATRQGSDANVATNSFNLQENAATY